MLHYCFQWIWLDSLNKGITRQQQGKIRKNSSANLVFKICDVFAYDYYINLTFTACLESKHFDNSRFRCKLLEFLVKSDMIKQLLTDTLIRGRRRLVK